MIKIHFWFEYSDLKGMDVQWPAVPREGAIVTFDEDDGEVYRVREVDWQADGTVNIKLGELSR